MSISLYDMTIPSYLQVINSTLGVMQKGEEHWQGQGKPLDDILTLSLHEDMLPFSFQIRSVVHHSLNAIKGILKGEFGPPQSQEFDYAALRQHLEAARDELKTFQPGDINALAGKQVIFRMGKMELPFTAENFVHSFSLPNFYFHATTAYDILRAQGVPLGKLDYLGQVRVGV